MKHISSSVAFAILFTAAAAAQDAGKPQSGPPRKDPNHVTLTGCVAGGDQANTYVLTKVPDQLSAGVNAATTGAVPTVNYLLVGSQDFKPHVGHRVEITGRIDHDAEKGVKTEDKKKTEPQATTKDVDPKVKVTERTRIEVRKLNVESMKMVATSCQ
jgi:hypothetical protein